MKTLSIAMPMMVWKVCHQTCMMIWGFYVVHLFLFKSLSTCVFFSRFSLLSYVTTHKIASKNDLYRAATIRYYRHKYEEPTKLSSQNMIE